MPAINVARTDTFERQRQKINQIGDQIFNITQGGSDLSTGNLKLGDGTKVAPSLGFISEPNLGIYKPALGVIGYVAGEKKLLNISTENISSYRDFIFKKDSLTTAGVSITDPGQNYDVGVYESIGFTGGTGKGATFNAEVISFNGSITNTGENYTRGSYSSINLTGGSGISGNTTVNFDVDPISGNVISLGSGYIPDTYVNVPFTGGSGSGARADIQITGTVILNGSITNNGTGYAANSYPGVNVYNNPTQTFTVTTSANGGTPPPNELYSIDGNVQGTFALTVGNTYRFDVSDSSNTGHPLDFRESNGNFISNTDFVVIRRGIEGSAGAFIDLVVKPTAPTGNIQYVCQNHTGMGAVVSVVTGTVGEYGTGATADVTVDANTTITGFTFVSSGEDYKTGDVLQVNSTELGGGSGFEYTLTTPTYQGTVTSVIVTDDGQDYLKDDILSASTSDLGGLGSGFQFLITSDPGRVKNLQFTSRGTGYSVGDVLSLPSGVTGITGTLKGSVNGLTTTLSTASTTVTLSSTSGIIAGMAVSTDIASTGQLSAGTTVQSVNSSTQITLSANPSVDGAATLSFLSPGTLEDVVVSDASGINIGDSVTQTSGNGVIPSNVTVQNVDTGTNTITLSVAPTLAGSATFSFSPQYGSPSTPFAFTVSSVNSVSSITVIDGGNGYEVGDSLTVNSTDLTKPITLNVFVNPVQLVTFVETISASVFSVGDVVEYSTGISTIQEEVYAVNVSGGNLVSLLISGSGLTETALLNKQGSGTQYTADTLTNSNKFFIDSGSGQQLTPDLTLYSGNKYEFNSSDSSNSGHPFRLSKFRDGKWAPSLITGITSTLTLSTQITVSSTTGISEGMEVSVTSGNGSIPIGTTVVSVDSGTQLTLSASPTLAGSSTLSFAGTEYTEGVTREGSSLTISITDSTPTLYYYCESHPNMGGDDNDEGVLTINTNNPKVFGSGLSVSVDDILSSNSIELKLLDGELVSSSLTSQTCTFNTVEASTSVSTNSLIANTFEVNSISSTGNIAVSSPNTIFSGGNLKVSTNLTVEPSGNLTTSGVLKTTNLVNVNDKIRISENIINTTTGNDLNLQPASGKFVTITSSSALVIPKGTTLERPDIATATNGAIRFNTDSNQYEGYNATTTSWSSLGGVRDIDGNTYILAELNAGANDNTLWFYNDAVNTLRLTTEFLDFRDVKKISSGRLGLPSFTLWSANVPVSVGDYVKYRNNLYEVTGAGTTASTGGEPTHTSGVVGNGTAQLTWYSSSVSPLTFEEIEEVRFGPNKDCPVVIGSELTLDDNTISTRVQDLIIQPNAGKQVIVQSNTHFRIPAGNNNEKNIAPAGAGSIRFNTEIQQFEGYSGTVWSSLGGVRDVDGNTYIIPESAPAANENILFFYNNNVNTLKLSESALDFTNIDTITTGGNSLEISAEIITLNAGDTTIDNTSNDSTFISSTKQYLDLGLSTGLNVDPILRLDDQGDVFLNTTFGSGTFNGVKVLDGALKEFELADYKIKTSTFNLIKGGSETSAVVLYPSATSKGCKVTVVSKSASGKRSMSEYSVIDNGTDIFHNEYASLNTSADQYTAAFDFNASTEARITLTLSDDHTTGDIVAFTVLVQEIK